MKLRQLEPELMDDPALNAKAHEKALAGLARINYWSAGVGILWNQIQTLARQKDLSSLRVLDVATGGGDVPIALWKKARKTGFDLTIDGCDKSPQAVAFAQAKAKKAGASVNFYVLDIFNQEIPAEYDIIINSLFLHHLKNDEVIRFLGRISRAAKQMIVVDDLERSATGLTLAFIGTRLLSTSPIVHADGVQSVRAAFTVSEMKEMISRAGITAAQIERHWPYRYLISWQK